MPPKTVQRVIPSGDRIDFSKVIPFDKTNSTLKQTFLWINVFISYSVSVGRSRAML